MSDLSLRAEEAHVSIDVMQRIAGNRRRALDKENLEYEEIPTGVQVWLVHNGRRQTMRQWAEELGMCTETLVTRLRTGWTVEEALTIPKRAKNLLVPTPHGEMTAREASEKYGVEESTVLRRLRCGYCPEDIVYKGELRGKKIEIGGLVKTALQWSKTFDLSLSQFLASRHLIVGPDVKVLSTELSKADFALPQRINERKTNRKNKAMKLPDGLRKARLEPIDYPDASIAGGWEIWQGKYNHLFDLYKLEEDWWTHSLDTAASFENPGDAASHAYKLYLEEEKKWR